MRTTGTTAIGIRTPLIREGDNIIDIVVDSVISYTTEDGKPLVSGDIIGVTEAVVARAQGNYATTDQIAESVRSFFPGGEVGVIFPILSRNRFSVQLKGIARGARKLFIQLSYPADEMGNHLITPEQLYESGINPYTQSFTLEEFRAQFGSERHVFTGVDYLELYQTIGNLAPEGVTIILSNNPCEILRYTKSVLVADIHTRARTAHQLESAGATVVGLDQILAKPVNGSGYNEEYGLLGSNKSDEERVKLFPRNCDSFVIGLQKSIKERTGATVEVMVYGDGAFKDPVGKIWELADPVVSPAYTPGLVGVPNEIKLKKIADTELAALSAEEADERLKNRIRTKSDSLVGKDDAEGTTPRRLTDLIGSLCDLISGSGDKGTPVVLVRGYFDNYATE